MFMERCEDRRLMSATVTVTDTHEQGFTDVQNLPTGGDLLIPMNIDVHDVSVVNKNNTHEVVDVHAIGSGVTSDGHAVQAEIFQEILTNTHANGASETFASTRSIYSEDGHVFLTVISTSKVIVNSNGVIVVDKSSSVSIPSCA